MKVTVTRLDTNTSEVLDVIENKKGRPCFIWNGEEHVLVDRTYPAEYTHINADKPMTDKFKFRVEITEGTELELHNKWN